MKKKIISAIVLFGVVGALGSGAAFTSAYLISGDKEVNSFNATKVDIGIEEDYNKPSNPQPGDVISKKPRAVNNSSIDVYVRMRAEVSNTDLLEPIVANSGWTLRFQAGILGYSIAGMKAFEGKFSYKNQLFS